MKIDTQAIHAGQHPDPQTGAVMTPVYQTSTYAQKHPGVAQWEYSRTHNPTRTALQDCLAALEGGTHGVCFASGLAAVDTVVRTLSPGDHVVCGDDVYGGTYRLFTTVFAKVGIDSASWISRIQMSRFLKGRSWCGQRRPPTRS